MPSINSDGQGNGTGVEFFPRAGDRERKYGSIQRLLGAEKQEEESCQGSVWITEEPHVNS